MSFRRDDVVEAIVTKLRAVSTSNGYTYAYRFVTRDPMGSENIGLITPGDACVGVYDTNEEKERLMSVTNATLTVIIEFYYMPKLGESKSHILNILLAEITKAIAIDQTLTNTSIMVQDVSNHIDIDGIYDKIVNGSITFQVIYRHGLFDPTKANC